MRKSGLGLCAVTTIESARTMPTAACDCRNKNMRRRRVAAPLNDQVTIAWIVGHEHGCARRCAGPAAGTRHAARTATIICRQCGQTCPSGQTAATNATPPTPRDQVASIQPVFPLFCWKYHAEAMIKTKRSGDEEPRRA